MTMTIGLKGETMIPEREKKILKRLADADTLICKNCQHADSCHDLGGCNGVHLDPPNAFCGCEDFIADLGHMGVNDA